MIQWHHATRTHYDFRLEWQGVMKSWAVTKGPSYHPEDKRLAVRTEDHPMDYNKFEGVIAPKQYGAGPVMIWDRGTWVPDDDPVKAEKKGHISFTIYGTRMKGSWHLVRMNTKEKRENWLLIKGADEFSLSQAKAEKFLREETTSVISGRTIDDILSGKRDKPAIKKSLKKTSPKKESTKADKVSLNNLQKKYSSPQLATLVDIPPRGSNWVHEIKYDGYRLIAFIKHGQVVLQTRSGKDWTHKFSNIAEALSDLKIDSAVLDCEACVIDEKGRTNFSHLQQALTDERPEKIEGWFFDLLYLNGNDYTKEKLSVRKAALAKVLKRAKPPLRYSEHFASGPDLLDHACKVGAEGLVSKDLDSHYSPKRSKHWLKSKCNLEQEFVIGGFMPAKDNLKAIGALLLGYYKNGKLLYAGKVGTGFSRKLAGDIYKKLIPLKISEAPFSGKVERGRRGYIFVKPEILCEISFLEWTPEGHIRHSVFKGLREDKNPKEVIEEIPEKLGKVKSKSRTAKAELIIDDVPITHAERIVFPDTKTTKGDIARYYQKIAPIMLPFVKGRFISLLRCTDGIKGQCFFQRNPMKGMGDRIKSKNIIHKGNAHEYLYVEDEKGLIQLAQMGSIEFHAWQSLVQDKGKPSQIIFDLDPDEKVPFAAVKMAAEDIRRRLKKRGLVSYPRVTGGKGIHVVAPIMADHDWDDIKEWVRDFGEEMEHDLPDVYVANMSKKRRAGKIFIDFFRNDFSATAIAPFSLRARDGARIAWPVSWKELDSLKNPAGFTIDTITKAQIAKAAKISKEFLKTRQKLIL